MSQDGFGTRTLNLDQDTGDPVEVLTFAPVLARAPEFAATVGDRVTRLARVRHAMYSRARKLERPSDGTLRLVSDHAPGWRLDHVLDIVENEQWTLPWIADRPGGAWVRAGSIDVPVVRIISEDGEPALDRYVSCQTRFPEFYGPSWAEGLPPGLQHWISTVRIRGNPVTYRLTGRTEIVASETWQECRLD